MANPLSSSFPQITRTSGMMQEYLDTKVANSIYAIKACISIDGGVLSKTTTQVEAEVAKHNEADQKIYRYLARKVQTQLAQELTTSVSNEEANSLTELTMNQLMSKTKELLLDVAWTTAAELSKTPKKYKKFVETL